MRCSESYSAPRDPATAAPALDGDGRTDVDHREPRLVADLTGVQPWAPPGFRSFLRRARRRERRGRLPTWTSPPRCNGHRFGFFSADGQPRGFAWYGYDPACGCPGCRREYVRRRVRTVERHGGLDQAVHLVATVPPELRAHFTRDRLGTFRRAAIDAACAAADEVLPDHGLLGGSAVVHPAGDASPQVYAPHFDLLLTGPGLEALADPAIRDRFLAAFRRRWREALGRLCDVDEVRRPQTFVRWYAGPDGAGEDEDGRRRNALAAAVRDSVRSFPGWNLDLRLVFFGTMRAVVERERPSLEPVFESGAIPFETLVEAHGDAHARFLLSRAEIEFYESRYAERLEREGVCNVSPRDGCAVAVEALDLEVSAPAVEGAMVVDLAGVAPWYPEAHTGRVHERVRAGDLRLRAALANLGRRIEAARRSANPAAPFALSTVRFELEALLRDVEHRARPSVADAAGWLGEVLRALVRRTDPIGLTGPIEALRDDPPIAISGLVATSELAFPHAQLNIVLEVAA